MTNMTLSLDNLKSKDWWIAAGWRSLRTALVIAIPYTTTVLYDDTVWLVLLETALFGAVLSLVTSVFSALPETTPTATPWGWAVLERVIKTTAQAIITFVGAAATFSEIDWTTAWQFIGTAVIGSALIAFMKGVPEAPLPVAAATLPALGIDRQGELEVSGVPIVTDSVPVALLVDRSEQPASETEPEPPITKAPAPGDPDH